MANEEWNEWHRQQWERDDRDAYRWANLSPNAKPPHLPT